MEVGSVELASGARFPRLGLGTWPMSDDEAEEAVMHAVSAGYRLFDTAENYRNERGVGRGLERSGLPREEFTLTTKFNVEWHVEDLRPVFEERVQLLGVDTSTC